MTLYVPEKAKQETTRCTNSFQCLSAPGSVYCTVIMCMIKSGTFPKGLHKSHGNYKELVEENHYKCTCPLKIELRAIRDVRQPALDDIRAYSLLTF